MLQLSKHRGGGCNARGASPEDQPQLLGEDHRLREDEYEKQPHQEEKRQQGRAFLAAAVTMSSSCPGCSRVA